MHLPQLTVRKQKQQKQTVAFRGLNYGQGAADGQLEDSRNITSAEYPCITLRDGRLTTGNYTSATAVYCRDGLFVVDGTTLYYDGVAVGTVSPGEKQFATINSKTVIYPDAVYYDVEKQKLISIAAEYTAAAEAVLIMNKNSIAIQLGNYAATVERSDNYGGAGTSESGYVSSRSDLQIVEGTRPFDGKITSVSVNTQTGEIIFGDKPACPKAEDINAGMLFYSAALGIDGVTKWGKVTKRWYTTLTPVGPGGTPVDIPRHFGFDYDVYTVTGSDYEKISSFEELGFQVGDAVEVSGGYYYTSTGSDTEKYPITGSYIIRELGEVTAPDLQTKLQAMTFDDDVFLLDAAKTDEPITIRRKAPKLSVICESQNRIWGADGNTIYASALGDPTNFFVYDGLDTDSYAVAVASEGKFTGCCGYGKSVLFFKEDRMIKILGDYPSQYTLYEYQVPGVKSGSEMSLCNVNESIYYHGREGIYRYSGGNPELISEVFGLHRYENAAAGAYGDRYYISMHERGTDGRWGMWVYDIGRGIWLQEDETKAPCFARSGEKLLYIDGDAQRLKTVNPDISAEEIRWSATLCRMDETVHNRKCYSKLYLRGELLEDEAWMQVEVSCDNGPFRRVYTSRDKRVKTLVVPIMPTRCDSFRIRLSGEGRFIIRSLVREYGLGSEY